ncbi:MAG TPA: DUF4912 domain-containing protein [Verrucomicrobiae bacterium]|nr:DUF4912 domain-containing protein [Verrucomicrobiae bacterium]
MLEGDEAPIAPVSGPGERFAVKPAVASVPAMPEPVAEAPASLPASYNTGRLFLAARDPHWLFLSWDFPVETLDRLRAKSPDRLLRLRIHERDTGGKVVSEIALPANARSWFERVGRPGARFAAQLGYYQSERDWMAVATSESVETPGESPAPEQPARFETLPAEVSLRELTELARASGYADKPLLEVLHELRNAGQPIVPPPSAPVTDWTPEREAALSRVMHPLAWRDRTRRDTISSLDLLELLKSHLGAGPGGPTDFGGDIELSSAGLAGAVPGLPPGAEGGPGLSGAEASPAAGFGAPPEEGEKSFWFNVNAELIIYGATEPTAKVTLGGRAIQLRRDGTFSYRFALPDGHYELEAVALSADGSDGRAAKLRFRRETNYRGVVGAHPQDPRLKTPHAHHVESTG